MSTERNFKTHLYITIRMPKGVGKFVRGCNVIVEESAPREGIENFNNIFNSPKNQTK
jgi:hypothetical protein